MTTIRAAHLSTLLLLVSVSTAPAQEPPASLPDVRHGVWTTASGDVVAEARDWRASFGRSAAALEVPPPEGDVAPRLELRYLGFGRGATWSPASAAVVPNRRADLVDYRHAGVTERYRIDARGFEQSFVFDAAPAGRGDLVLRIAVAGNVQAEGAPARHQAIEFAQQGARVIRYGEGVAFGRGGARVAIATRYDGVSTLELIVPEDLVENATYPLVVDPAVGPIFNPGGAGWSDTDPDVSYDIEHERYMVVWQRAFSSTNIQIRGQIYERDGTPHGGLIQVTTTGTNLRPALAWCDNGGDTSFLVAWEQFGVIRAQLRNADTGAAIGVAFDASAPPPGASDARPDVAGNLFDNMWVGWERTPSGYQDANEILVRCLDFTSIPPWSTGDHSVVVVPFSSGHVRGVRLGESAIQVQAGGQWWSALRATWGRFYNSPAPGDTDIWTAAFRHKRFTGQFVQIDPPSAVPGGNGVGPDEVTPDIGMRFERTSPLTGIDQQLIAWEDEGDIHAHRYDLYGPIGSEIVVRATSATELMPTVGAGYCEFTVGYGEALPPNEFDVVIRAARVLPDGSVPTNNRPVDVGTVAYQSGLRASSRPMDIPGAEQTNTSLLVWWGQTGPSGTGLNDVRARLFEPVAPTESPYGSPCPGPLGELPTIGTLGGPAVGGNEDLRLTVTNAPNNTLALLLIGDILATAPIPGAPGCELYVGLPVVAAMPAVVNNSGFGSVIVDLPCSIPHGTTLAFQWGIFTPGWNSFGWITSDDLDIYWSQL